MLGGNASNDSNNPLGDELVENGDFDEIGAEEILNGDFSEIGGELVENGTFTPGEELVENGNFQDFEDATDSNLDGGVQFANWNVNPSTGKRRLTAIADGFRNDVIVKQTEYWQQRVYQSVSTDLEVGKYYRFKATFITSDANTIAVRISTLNSSNIQVGSNYPTEPGISQSIDLFFKCTSITSQYINIFPSVTQEIGESFYLQNVSITEVGQEWSLGTGWSIGDGKALREGVSSNSFISQTIDIVAGATYTISYDRTYISGGGITNLYSAFITSGVNTTLGRLNSTVQETVTVTDTFTPTYTGSFIT